MAEWDNCFSTCAITPTVQLLRVRRHSTVTWLAPAPKPGLQLPPHTSFRCMPPLTSGMHASWFHYPSSSLCTDILLAIPHFSGDRNNAPCRGVLVPHFCFDTTGLFALIYQPAYQLFTPKQLQSTSRTGPTSLPSHIFPGHRDIVYVQMYNTKLLRPLPQPKIMFF